MLVKNLLHLGCWVKSDYVPSAADPDKFYKVVCICSSQEGGFLIDTGDHGWDADDSDLKGGEHIVTFPTKCWHITISNIKEIKGYFSSKC